MEEQGATGLAERQISQFIENHQVGIHQPMRKLSLLASRLLQFQGIDRNNPVSFLPEANPPIRSDFRMLLPG